MGFEALKAIVNLNSGVLETEPVDAATLGRVSERLHLPASFQLLYADAGPVPGSSIPWVVEEMLLFSFSELPDAQVGYSVATDHAPSAAWSHTWVVVGTALGDPFFIDVSRENCPVLFARHGAGSWSPTEVASSMAAFIESLAHFERVLLGDFNRQVWDEDGLLPAFAREVERGLAEVLTPEQASAFVALLE